jgi:hypothetical protein
LRSDGATHVSATKLDNSALLIPEGAADPELAQTLLLIESLPAPNAIASAPED